MSDKKQLRTDLFARLKAISLGDRRRATARICATLSCLPEVKASRTIAAYSALKSEPDLRPLFQAPPGEGSRFCMSRITGDDHLDFHLVESEDHLRKGSHGILEPDPDRCPGVEPDDIDLILVPGVAFDPKTFARLGRGKGHYDRFLERLRLRFASARVPAPVVLGVAYQCQLVDVPAESHDQAMDGIVTEKAFLRTPLEAIET